MTDHEHIEMLIDGVDRERPRRVGARRQDVRQRGHADNVRSMAAAGAFRVVRVDRPAGNGGDGVLDEAGFIERIGMDGDLDIVAVRDIHAAIDRRRRRPPVFVELQSAGARADLLLQRTRQAAVALSQKTHVDRERLGGLEHAFEVPGAGRTRGGIGACGGPRAAAQKCGQPGCQGGLAQLRTDEVDMTIDPTRRGDEVFAGNHLRAGADHQPRIDSGLDERIARLTDGHDPSAPDADVPFDNAPVVEKDRVGNDEIERRLGLIPRKRGLALAIADDLPAAELDLLAVDGVVLLDLDDQLGIRQANAITRRWTIVACIRCTRKSDCHGRTLSEKKKKEHTVSASAAMGLGGMLSRPLSVCQVRRRRRRAAKAWHTPRPVRTKTVG